MEEGGQQGRRHGERRDVVSGRRHPSRGLHLGEERRPRGLRQPQVTARGLIHAARQSDCDAAAVPPLQVRGAGVAAGLHPHQHAASGERQRRLGLRRLQLHGAQLAGPGQTGHPARQHK